jgi:hypothetical protein
MIVEFPSAVGIRVGGYRFVIVAHRLGDHFGHKFAFGLQPVLHGFTFFPPILDIDLEGAGGDLVMRWEGNGGGWTTRAGFICKGRRWALWSKASEHGDPLRVLPALPGNFVALNYFERIICTADMELLDEFSSSKDRA